MPLPELPGVLTGSDVAATVASIAAVQLRSGAIPWFPGGHTDPWDHVESAMALDVGGLHGEAAAAYRWLARAQRGDGSWAASYRGDAVESANAETNYAAYVAVGCWHHWLATRDDAFLVELWPTVDAALGWVLRAQQPTGEIAWALQPDGSPDPMALVTGCSSIHQALRCGLAIAERLGRPQPDWELAVGQLRHALVRHPSAFVDKERYSMDWYYPVLGGALRGPAALERIEERWSAFVVDGLGARCVSDRPWVTGAETCELALTLQSVGDERRAAEMVAAMQHLRHPDGSYWTGLVFDEGVRWPVERTTWTAAAVVLAVDAIAGTGPQSAIFSGDGLPADVEVGPCDADLLCGR